MGKQFELLKEVVPTVTRVAAIEDPTRPYHEGAVRRLQAVTQSLGLYLHLVTVRDPATELERAFAGLRHARVEAIRIAAGPPFSHYQAQIVELVAQSQLP